MSEPRREDYTALIEPQILSIHVTYRCPLRCDHCCFSSDRYQLGHLDVEQVKHLIDDASSLASLKLVGFTGGDPFLHHKDVLGEAIAHAKARRLRTRIVTSAFWAGTAGRARAVLAPLAAAGLTEITISYDDSHAEFVKDANIANAYHAARELGVFTAITICKEPGARIDRAYIESLVGVEPDEPDSRLLIFETRVTTVGRALDESGEQKRTARKTGDVYLGPCPFVLRQPTITPTLQILPCCGTIPFRAGMQIGDAARGSVADAIRDAYDDPLLKWIAFEGPAAILRQITADGGQPLDDGDFDGICNACDVLFSDPALERRARDALPHKLRSLQLQEAIYSEAGIYRPPAAPAGRGRGNGVT